MSRSDLHPTETSRLQWLKHAITMVRTSSVTIAIFDIRALATGGNLAAEGEVILLAVSRTTLVDMSIVSRNCLYLFIVPSEFILRCIHCPLFVMDNGCRSAAPACVVQCKNGIKTSWSRARNSKYTGLRNAGEVNV